MFDRTVFFRLVASRKATPFGGGQERNAICEENRESGSMHPLSERDRAKKDYGRSPTRAEVRSTSIRGKLSILKIYLLSSAADFTY